MIRLVEDCPYRREIETSPASYCCGLVEQILDKTQRTIGAVPLAACETCVRSFPPTSTDPNPVVASLIYSAATDAIESETPGSVAHRQCEAAIRFADTNLPRVLPDEDDLSVIESPALTSKVLSHQEIQLRLPIATSDRGTPMPHWVVGMTTATRRQPTLAPCLDAMAACGIPAPHLFIDGDVDIPSSHQHLPRTIRQPAAGAWVNFFLSLSEMVERHPSADVYLMTQDDVLWPSSPDLFRYLTHEPLLNRAGRMLSLYTSVDDNQTIDGWKIYDGQWRLGALAFAFPRSVARRLTADPKLRRHAWTGGPMVAGVDFAVGKWAFQRGIEILHPTPSIVQHGGHVSSIWETSRVVGLRRAANWLGSR